MIDRAERVEVLLLLLTELTILGCQASWCSQICVSDTLCLSFIAIALVGYSGSSNRSSTTQSIERRFGSHGCEVWRERVHALRTTRAAAAGGRCRRVGSHQLRHESLWTRIHRWEGSSGSNGSWRLSELSRKGCGGRWRVPLRHGPGLGIGRGHVIETGRAIGG